MIKQDEHIRVVITEDGLFSKWVGAELVSAIDSGNMGVVGYVLRARHTLTTTVMLGRPDHPEDKIEIYVEALNEEGRSPVAIFQMSRELYGEHKSETDKETLVWLADVIREHYCQVVSEYEDDEQKEMLEMVVSDKPVDKRSN